MHTHENGCVVCKLYRYIGNKSKKLMYVLLESSPLVQLEEHLQHSRAERGKVYFLITAAIMIIWRLYNPIPFWGSVFYILFTATECSTFLLYCVPVLHGILPDKYVAHCLLFSKAIRLLLSDAITPADIELADSLLRLFWRLTEQYYGEPIELLIEQAHTHHRIVIHIYSTLQGLSSARLISIFFATYHIML